MEKAAAELDFIEAARFRDEMADLQNLLRKKVKKSFYLSGRLPSSSLNHIHGALSIRKEIPHPFTLNLPII